jgi:molybdate-binding protein/DNA-binding XRE family transcriptional regulator
VSEIANYLAAAREKRGISAAALASQIGISRQTVYAYTPNTAVALRLARALDVGVEELFSLDPAEPAPRKATALPGTPPGASVQLCRVEDRLVASAPSPGPCWFPSSDGTYSGPGSVWPSRPTGDYADRILLAGCDPGSSLLASHARAAGVELILAHRNSTEAVKLLGQGLVHIAGTHLARLPRDKGLSVVTFAVWETGIVTKPGNPRGIRTLSDFTGKGVRMVNREAGSGSRSLLDEGLRSAGIGTARLSGYDREVAGHLAAAWAVSSGWADCSIATRAAAQVFGLGFVPLASETYHLVLRKSHLQLAPVRNLLDVLTRRPLRRDLEQLGGYDTSDSGRICS